MKTTKITMKKVTSNTITINDAWADFIKKANVRNLSKLTIKTYQNHYDMFIRFIDKDTPCQSINSNTIDNFILYLRNNTSANDVTVTTYLRSMRAFLYFCMENDYVKSFKIKMPKTEKKIKETYSNAELLLLLKKPNLKECTFTEYKIWTFENYLLATGNRISSALNVRISDINFDDNVIIIRKTKNRNQCIIPLSSSLAEILREYLSYRGGDPEDYLFCNACGGKADQHTYQCMVYDYNHSRNVNKTSCHLFRHTFAKNWILSGGDIFRLQKILGHSDLSVVREYVNMFSNDLSLDFDRFNPLDNMMKNKTTINMR